VKSSPAPGVTLTVSTIIDGTLYGFGQPLPFQSVDDPEFPKHLKRYVLKRENAESRVEETNLRFQLNQTYHLNG
jgi:hypothetical protein